MRSGAAPRMAAALVAALVASACGGQLTDEEILAASGVSTAPVGAEATRPGSSPRIDVEVSGAPRADDVQEPRDGPGPGPAPGTSTPGGIAAEDAAAPSNGAAPTTVEPGAGGPAGTPGETGPIIVGSVGNYSGPPGAAIGRIPRGVQIWAAMVNARGGLFGREVQVIVVDDGGDPARYASAVRDLVENRGAVAFVGNGVPLTVQGGEYLERNGIPVIGGDGSRVEWYDDNVLFPVTGTPETQMLGLVHAGVALTGNRRFGYLVCTEADSCTQHRGVFTEENFRRLGAELTYVADIGLTQVDFTAECRQAQQAGVDLFYVSADPNTILRVARSCDRQGFRPQYTMNSYGPNDEVLAQSSLATGTVAHAVFPFVDGSGEAFAEYRQAVDTFGGGHTDPSLAVGWASAKLFELAATRAAETTQSINSASLLAALRTVADETLGGLTVPLDFSRGAPALPPCYFPMQGDGTRWTAPRGMGLLCLP